MKWMNGPGPSRIKQGNDGCPSFPFSALYQLLLFCLLILWCMGCDFKQTPVSLQFPALRGDATLILSSRLSDDDQRRAKQIVMAQLADSRAAFDSLESGSELNAINRIGTTTRFPLKRDTYRLLLLCQKYTEMTQGAFDISTAPYAMIWGFLGCTLPSEPVSDAMIAALRHSVGPESYRLAENTIELRTPNTRINVDDIMDAYTLDLAVLALRESSFSPVYLQLGGAARGLGQPDEQHQWTYDIPDPFNPMQSLGSIMLAEDAAARSSISDRYVVIQGQQYGHIIDPFTGRPANRMALVVVVAPTATEAQALAQALFVLGFDAGLQLRSFFPRCDMLFVPNIPPATIQMTPRMAQRFLPRSDAPIDVEMLSGW
ncbi:MAG: hypothetical protein EOL87_05305 [Spartobacteria bacterium]|nr:hypothetical protein [Spartobacteria bacterium]